MKMKIHLDLDCYFVSAERTRYPFLKDKNVVVVKSSDNEIFSHKKKQSSILDDSGAFNSVLEFHNKFQADHILNVWKNMFIDKNNGNIHGIVITKSYEAKKYGIKTGTPLKEALKMCPDLYIIPSDHFFYQQISKRLKEYLELKIPVIEQYSIDEFFGDLDGWINDEDTYDFIKELRDDIMDKFNLPITIGASGSKWTAKLITDRIKPYGVFALPKKYILPYINNISINEFPGIGRAIFKKLNDRKIKTLGEVVRNPQLFDQYGKTGRDLYKRITGTDNERVVSIHNRKGIGISRNFKAIENRAEVYRRASILARYLAYSIAKLRLNPTTFHFKIKYAYHLKSKQSLTVNRLFNEKFLIDLTHSMIRKLDLHPNHKIHYIAIHASNFISTSNIKTLNLLHIKEDRKYLSLQNQLNKVRDKYGIDSIKYARECG